MEGEAGLGPDAIHPLKPQYIQASGEELGCLAGRATGRIQQTTYRGACAPARRSSSCRSSSLKPVLHPRSTTTTMCRDCRSYAAPGAPFFEDARRQGCRSCATRVVSSCQTLHRRRCAGKLPAETGCTTGQAAGAQLRDTPPHHARVADRLMGDENSCTHPSIMHAGGKHPGGERQGLASFSCRRPRRKDE